VIDGNLAYPVVTMFKNIFKGFGHKKAENRSLEVFLVDAIDMFENGNFDEAIKNFSLIAKAFPEHPIVHIFLARAYIEMNQYEEAINSLFEHLKIVPNSVEALIYLGLTYYECGEIEQAQERYEQALELRKDYQMVRENLAITHVASGELTEALDELVNLHQESPNDLNILELLVLTLGKLGKWEAAKRYVNKMNNTNFALDI